MPVKFTPDNIPRYENTFLSYLNENFIRLKNALTSVAVETISTSAPATPYIGQRYTNPSLGIDYVWDGVEWVVTTHWGAPFTFTHVWTQTNTITHTVTLNKYYVVGQYVYGQCYLNATSAGVANIPQTVTKPIASATNSNQAVGAGWFFDQSLSVNTDFVVYISSDGKFYFITTDISSGFNLGETGSGNPNAVASGDYINFFYSYERA